MALNYIGVRTNKGTIILPACRYNGVFERGMYLDSTLFTDMDGNPIANGSYLPVDVLSLYYMTIARGTYEYDYHYIDGPILIGTNDRGIEISTISLSATVRYQVALRFLVSGSYVACSRADGSYVTHPQLSGPPFISSQLPGAFYPKILIVFDNNDVPIIRDLGDGHLGSYLSYSDYFGIAQFPDSDSFGSGYNLIYTLYTTGESIGRAGANPILDFSEILSKAIVRIPQPDDPFGPGGTSEPGGGGGTFDDDSDEIPDSSLPTLSAANTGFTRIYNPTLSQVQAMANYLWTDNSVIETIWNHIKQFLEDPMDAFIAFNLIPCAVPNGGTSNFKVMYIDTGVAMTTAANQFVDVDCGTVQLERYYGSALDYTPYTRVGCFLPYIGTVELDTDEVMGATLQVKYRIDIVSGACVAKILVDGNCLYQYSGHCAINIPFTSADFSNYVNAIIQVAKAGLIAASGVPIAAVGAGEAAEQLTGRTVTTTTTTQRSPATGRQVVTGRETVESNIYSTEASFKGLSPTNLANTVGAVMGSKPMIEHSGGFNGNSGYLGVRRPFLVIKRPRMCNPSGYGTLNGYPCMIKETLGNLSGFTQVQQVQLTGLSATNPEQAEILQLLKQGVIL